MLIFSRVINSLQRLHPINCDDDNQTPYLARPPGFHI
jgi:hypothetical protein